MCSVVLAENVGGYDNRGGRNEAEIHRYIIGVRYTGKWRLGLWCDLFIICCPFKCMQLRSTSLLGKKGDLLSVTDGASVTGEGGDSREKEKDGSCEAKVCTEACVAGAADGFDDFVVRI